MAVKLLAIKFIDEGVIKRNELLLDPNSFTLLAFETRDKVPMLICPVTDEE
jgi:hypothetical protein